VKEVLGTGRMTSSMAMTGSPIAVQRLSSESRDLLTTMRPGRKASSRTFSLSRASLMGRVVRGMATAILGVSSAMAAVCVGAIGRTGVALDVLGAGGCGRRRC
jgi:hypothetical protein